MQGFRRALPLPRSLPSPSQAERDYLKAHRRQEIKARSEAELRERVAYFHTKVCRNLGRGCAVPCQARSVSMLGTGRGGEGDVSRKRCGGAVVNNSLL